MWGFGFLVLDGPYCCAVVSFTMLAVTDAAADVLTITTIRLIAMIIININITERSMDCGRKDFLVFCTWLGRTATSHIDRD